jgi:ABC-type phosphate/phosphonate transport system permease subunit
MDMLHWLLFALATFGWVGLAAYRALFLTAREICTEMRNKAADTADNKQGEQP